MELKIECIDDIFNWFNFHHILLRYRYIRESELHVIFQKMYSYNCDGVCIQIEYMKICLHTPLYL